MGDPTRLDPNDTGRLVREALAGERAAWETIVEGLKGVAWRVIWGFDLSAEDRDDAFAATFFRLYERLDSVREPEKLPGWVASTARNEVLTLLRARRRERPSDQTELFGEPAPDESGDRLLDDELLVGVRAGFERLSAACQELLRLLTADPPLSYDEISTITGMPHGSIGPTRQRCLGSLRDTPEMRPFLEAR
jgi:RNA polymerase sigma factor (sigma-70 family)